MSDSQHTDIPDRAPQRGFLGRFLHEWQELLVWLPIVLAMMLGLFWLLPRLDPRTGIDGWGDLWQLVGAVLSLFVLFFVAWLGKRTYGTDLSDQDVQDLRERAVKQPSWQALTILLLDRLEWLGWLCIAYLVLQR